MRGPRRNPAKRFRWGKEEQRSERVLLKGQNEGYGACDDAVKGHATNPYNNRCDELAVSQWQKLK